MASRNEHAGASKPGSSWASGSSADVERKTAHMPFPQSAEPLAPPRVESSYVSSYSLFDVFRLEYARGGEEHHYERAERIDQFNKRVDRRANEEAKKQKEADEIQLLNQEARCELIAVPLVQSEMNEFKTGIESKIRPIDIKEAKEGIKKRESSSGKHHKMSSGVAGKGDPVRGYKVMYDHNFMTHLKTKDFVRRYNGKCGDKYKQFDYPQAPMDPRSKFRRVDQPKNLIVPNLVVDDQYTGIPPKREVTISNLNDNVNKDFLLKMTRSQKLDPQDVQVFYHPRTKKHLEMAHILFLKSKDARMFVEANNGVSVMGKPINCKLDPFAADLNALYTPLVGSPLPPLPYLSGMSEHELSLKRDKIIGSTAGDKLSVEEAAAFTAVAVNAQDTMRSLSPMDTSNSPLPIYESLPPNYPQQPPFEPPMQPQLAYVENADALTSSKHITPPPPYSELPPTNHEMYEGIRSESRKRMGESEEKMRREKRRRESTSSSSSYSSGAEQSHSNGSRRRSDGGVKKKREEYLKVKRFVSSERDSNSDKIIRKEVKTVTYKRRTERTEQRTTLDQKKVSPDSFDEEMKRRERSMSRSTRNSERGRDEMRWSSPSSDSDNGGVGSGGTVGGGGRRKKGKERVSESQSREDERRASHPADPIPSTPSSTNSSVPSSVTRRNGRSGFHCAPIFDPTLPPPFIVPPVGLLVLPDCSSLPSLPPQPPVISLPPMMAPPPPLPGGFIPPPEAFGIQMTPAMMLSAMVFAPPAGMTSLPPSLPPPPMGSYGNETPLTPHHHYSSPAKPSKMLHKMGETISSPSSGMHRASSSSSLTASERTPSDLRAMATSTTPSEGGSTPQTSSVSAADKKANLDDRLTQIFGLKKAKKEEDAAREMKHAASAPSISALVTAEQRAREDDDMDIEDDDMDVASSSSSVTGGGGAMMSMMERRGGEGRETEEDRRKEEEAARKLMEEQAAELTRITLDKLIKDLEQQVVKDINRKLETTSMNTLDKWMKRAQQEEEERKKQMIRDSLAAAAARDASLVTPKKDPMEEMLAAKLLSPEGLSGRGISKMLSSIPMKKKKDLVPDFSRDGTPASRDSRAASKSGSRQSTSRSSSRSASSSSDEDDGRRKKRNESTSSSEDSSSDSDDGGNEPDNEIRKATRKRPNMRNIESSQSSAASTSFESSSDSSESSNEAELDVVGISEDEAEKIKEECSSPAGPSTTATAVAATGSLATEDNNQEVPFSRQRSMQPPVVQRFSQQVATATTVARGVGQVPLASSTYATVVPPSSQQLLYSTKKETKKTSIPKTIQLDAFTRSVTQPAKKVEKKDKTKKLFEKRTHKDELWIRDSFKAGMDEEDEKHTADVLAELQAGGVRPFGYSGEVPFESRIRAYTPLELPTTARLGKLDLYYDDNELAGIVPHTTGCARSQGFYRLTTKQKIRIMRRPEAYQDRTEINERDEIVSRHQVQAQKEQRSMNRRLQTMVDSNPNSEFFKVNQLKYRKKMIKFARSRIHGWGLYALEPIAPDDMIVEYIGQKIRPSVADEREKAYERRGIGSSYLFRIDEDEVIDATKQGNFARFINHSCQPNCYAKVMTVDGDKRIVIYSKALIQKGDEITYDYKFPIEVDKIECLCGAPQCRGTLN